MAEQSNYEIDAVVPVRERRGPPTAAVLYHGGRLHFVQQHSAAERRYLDEGALYVGTLRFDDPARGAPALPLTALPSDPLSRIAVRGSTRN
jgi:hypothetical protein